MKYTPGPWQVIPPTAEQIALNYKSYSVDPVGDHGHGICTTYRKANAHLIAAAPGMLATLEHVYEAIKDSGPGFDELRIRISVAIDAAKGGFNE